MLRALSALLLAAQAAPATPTEDWWYLSLAADDPADMASFYADLASRRRSGDRVTISQATEYQRVSEQGNLSSRTTTVYDCRARTAQITAAFFLGPDGQVRETSPGDPAPHGIDPGSVYEMTMDFACGRTEGLEQLGRLGLREHALLLFREYLDRLAASREPRR